MEDGRIQNLTLSAASYPPLHKTQERGTHCAVPVGEIKRVGHPPVQKQLIQKLLAHAELRERVERLTTIDGIGKITALTWALEIGDPTRFPSCAKVMSYCGLTSALRSSADKQQRGPISKQRNHWLQTALIEAAKLAPRWNPQLAALHARELECGHRNRATLAVARKLACYLLAVDKSRQPFQMRVPSTLPANVLPETS